jgi:POT family proton-dependent oligopeptide transporter
MRLAWQYSEIAELRPCTHRGRDQLAVNISSARHAEAGTVVAVRARDRLLFGHPRGLAFIAATELWDRISFHGMQALLVLYMVGQLLLPGHVEHIAGFAGLRAGLEAVTGPLSTQALASQIFGIYVGLVYFTPVIGGMMGDRLLGRVRAVSLGALLMTAGHFCLAFDKSFLIALLLLITGAGLLRGNLAPQLGELYATDDRRRTAAFQIYGSAINIGAFIAPLATGALGYAYGWHMAFAFAGFGMLLGLFIYLSGRQYLPEEPLRRAPIARQAFTPHERRAIVLLFVLVPISALFWIAQSQVWNTYNLWVRDHVALRFGDWTMPIPWLQSLDGIAPFLFLPAALALWRWQASRGAEPNEFTKMAIGCFLFGASTFWLAWAQLAFGAHRAPLVWAIAFHAGSNIGWLYFSPVVLALYSRLAPRAVNATMMGVYFLSVFLGSVISGRLGGLYEKLSPFQFWSLHAALCASGGVLLLVIGAFVAREFKPAGMHSAPERSLFKRDRAAAPSTASRSPSPMSPQLSPGSTGEETESARS